MLTGGNSCISHRIDSRDGQRVTGLPERSGDNCLFGVKQVRAPAAERDCGKPKGSVTLIPSPPVDNCAISLSFHVELLWIGGQRDVPSSARRRSAPGDARHQGNPRSGAGSLLNDFFMAPDGDFFVSGVPNPVPSSASGAGSSRTTHPADARRTGPSTGG